MYSQIFETYPRLVVVFALRRHVLCLEDEGGGTVSNSLSETEYKVLPALVLVILLANSV